jgi:hypothetical protein
MHFVDDGDNEDGDDEDGDGGSEEGDNDNGNCNNGNSPQTGCGSELLCCYCYCRKSLAWARMHQQWQCSSGAALQPGSAVMTTLNPGEIILKK